MAKRTPSVLDSMPANVVKLHKLPVTEPRFFVLDLDTGKRVHTENRAWYSYDKARSLKNQGRNVDVYGWDENAGKHRPVSEFMTKVNDHGIVDGNWYEVATWRHESARSKRTGRTVEKTDAPVVRDDTTADLMKSVSQILGTNASAMRRGDLSGQDIKLIFDMVQNLSDVLYELTPVSPAPVEE